MSGTPGLREWTPYSVFSDESLLEEARLLASMSDPPTGAMRDVVRELESRYRHLTQKFDSYRSARE